MLTFPTHLFNPSRIQPRLMGVAITGGETLSGIVDNIRTDGGGYWQLGCYGISLHNDDLVRAWRAWEATLDGGVTRVLVPVPDVRMAPRPIVAGKPGSPSGMLEGSDDPYFPEAVGFASPFVVARVAATAALRATSLQIEIVRGQRLKGGEHFALTHATKGRRVYRVARVLARDGQIATVQIRPPLREAIAADASADFDWPSFVATLLPEAEISPEIEYGRHGVIDITFREAF